MRFKSLSILGHTNFAVPPDELAEHYRRLVGHAIAGDIVFEVERVPLDDVAAAWRRQADGAGTKLVVVPVVCSPVALEPARVVSRLGELRSLTGDENGAQRVAWTETWATRARVARGVARRPPARGRARRGGERLVHASRRVASGPC